MAGVSLGSGTIGVIRCGPLVVATLHRWEASYSPNVAYHADGTVDEERSHLPVVFGFGIVGRYWLRYPPQRAVAYLTPRPAKYRIDRRQIPARPPFVVIGTVHSISASQVVINQGEIHPWPFSINPPSSPSLPTSMRRP